jgi:hypothetical protein
MYTFFNRLRGKCPARQPRSPPQTPAGTQGKGGESLLENLEKVEEMFFIHSHAFTPPATDSHERTQWSKSCAGCAIHHTQLKDHSQGRWGCWGTCDPSVNRSMTVPTEVSHTPKTRLRKCLVTTTMGEPLCRGVCGEGCGEKHQRRESVWQVWDAGGDLPAFRPRHQ